MVKIQIVQHYFIYQLTKLNLNKNQRFEEKIISLPSLSNTLYLSLCTRKSKIYGERVEEIQKEKNREAWPVTSDSLHRDCLQHSSFYCGYNVCMTCEKIRVCIRRLFIPHTIVCLTVE